MKKKYLYSLLFFLVLIIFGNSCLAQKNNSFDSLPKNIIKINPWGMYWGSYTISYERFIGQKNSLEISANFKYNLKNKFIFSDNNELDSGMIPKATGFMTVINFRHYFSSFHKKNNYFFFYYSPFFRYSHLNFSNTAEDFIYSFKINSFKTGITLGLLKTFNKITIDAFFGPQLIYNNNGTGKYYNLPWEKDSFELPLKYISLGIRGGVTIGYSF
ncbi:MAG: hypothetical protein V1904_14995 [Bacteroidota bacterium]